MKNIDPAIATVEAALRERENATQPSVLTGIVVVEADNLVAATKQVAKNKVSAKQRRRIVSVDRALNRIHIDDLVGSVVTDATLRSYFKGRTSVTNRLAEAAERIDYLPFIERQVLRGRIRKVAKSEDIQHVMGDVAEVPRPAKAARKTYLPFNI